MAKKEVCTAVIVAGGKGTRMGTAVSKQFLLLEEKPILAHTIAAFQNADMIDAIVVVVPEHQVDYVREEIVDRYALTKVTRVIAGGAERYDSVYQGLLACEDTDIVYIHDGVRPFVTEAVLKRGLEACHQYGNAICGVPSKDTVKVTDEDGVVVDTPLRAHVWSVQTPQIFSYPVIRAAYDRILQENTTGITDDAMILEKCGEAAVHMYMGDYRNIKITTPEDLEIAEVFLRKPSGDGKK